MRSAERDDEPKIINLMDALKKSVAEAEAKHHSEPHWVRIAPFRSDEGDRCGLCDGWHRHEHPRVECSRCGKSGLQENWPFDCCGKEGKQS